MYRKTLARYRSLIHLSHTVYNHTVKRNHISGSYYNGIIRFYTVNINQYLFTGIV